MQVQIISNGVPVMTTVEPQDMTVAGSLQAAVEKLAAFTSSPLASDVQAQIDQTTLVGITLNLTTTAVT